MQTQHSKHPSYSSSDHYKQNRQQKQADTRTFGQLEPSKYAQIEKKLNVTDNLRIQQTSKHKKISASNKKQYISCDNAKEQVPSKNKKIDLCSINNQRSSRSTIPNQLPINLFHSAAEYRRILITNGKTMVPNHFSVDGILTSLQYINQPIYEAQQQKFFQQRNSIDFRTIELNQHKSIRNSVRRPHSVKNFDTDPRKSKRNQGNKKIQSSTDEGCICCCCNNFCYKCEQNLSNKHKSCAKNKRINYSATVDVNIQDIMARNRHTKANIKKERKDSLRQKSTLNDKKYTQKQKNSKISISSHDEIKNPLKNKRIEEMVDLIKQKKRNYVSRAISVDNKQISRNSQSINSLLFSSMCKFQEQRRMKAAQQSIKLKMRQQKIQKLKQLDFIIRMENKEILAGQKPSMNKIKKIDRKKVAFDYWASIRSQIKDQLAKSRVSKKSILKEQNKQQCHQRQYKMSSQQIQILRQKYEKQAIKKIKKTKLNGIKQKKRIATSLDKLQRKRNKIMKQCDYIPFKPSQKQIEEAFINLNPIEPLKP